MHMIQLCIDDKLSGRSLYALAKESGIGYSTLHKLYSGKTRSIDFELLDRLCVALQCAPCDLLIQIEDKKRKTTSVGAKRQSVKK